MKSKLKVTDDIQVELYPCNPNRYKWQRLKSGDISQMKTVLKMFPDIQFRIIETAIVGNYEFWGNKKDLAGRKR